jgi:hypothetical protein
MRRREFIWGLAARRVVDCGAGAAPTALIYPLVFERARRRNRRKHAGSARRQGVFYFFHMTSEGDLQ